MTVQDLIDELSAMPRESIVVYADYTHGEFVPVTEVRDNLEGWVKIK